MGASGWSYRVPYRDDVQAALDALRADVFAAGTYDTPWKQFPDLLGELADEVASYGADPASVARLRAGEAPGSIDEAIEWSTTEGTHSILDVAAIGTEPGFGVVTAADPALLVELLGTDRPDAEALWAARDALDEHIEDRWVGLWAVGYTDGAPSTIVFVGVSGD